MKSYLMWVGECHYATIGDYCDEAAARGVSKRLPGSWAVEALGGEDAVIFVAHDEGERVECETCKSELPCLDCDGTGSRGAVGTRCETCRGRDKESCHACCGTGKMLEPCPACDGFSTVVEGTGGISFVDGEPVPYRRAWNLKKARSGKDKVFSDEVACPTCGGWGTVPLGRVFGLVVPSGFEYILPPDAPPEVRAEMVARGVRVVDTEELREEPPRKCGTRVPGGFYVVTKSVASGKTPDVLAELAWAGKIDLSAVEMHGDFIRFLKPVDIAGQKRFRGVRRWDMPVHVRHEAEMILEAVA